MVTSVKINRAPVLTLWGVVVAERLGYKHEEALTFGKALAGLNAQSKGRSLGIYSPAEKELEAEKAKKARERKAGETTMVEVVGRMIPAVQTVHGLRAAIDGVEIDPKSVERYLEKKFGANLADVQAALESLAQAYPPDELNSAALRFMRSSARGSPRGSRAGVRWVSSAWRKSARWQRKPRATWRKPVSPSPGGNSTGSCAVNRLSSRSGECSAGCWSPGSWIPS